MNCKNCEYAIKHRSLQDNEWYTRCTYEEGECVKITELKAQVEQLVYLHEEDVNTIKLLNKRIEKMKCCENCNNYQHRIDHRCNTKCKNLSEWEIKEND